MTSETSTAPSSHARQYLIIFGLLAALTALEVAVAYLPGHRQAVMATLFALAVVKAACVALFFMHLKWEARLLRLIVVIPLALPVIYALVLITESVWRRIG